MGIKSKDIVCLGSTFDHNRQVMNARRFIWRLAAIQRQHRSTQWKKDRVYKLVEEFTR